MIVKHTEFIKSATKPAHYPEETLWEIAFAGRSNVGKSSLINVLVNRKNLVRTSNTPGRTQLINFFRINNAFTFVDLPGYGFAKVPLAVKKEWGPMIETYLSRRENLRGVVVISREINMEAGKLLLLSALSREGLDPIWTRIGALLNAGDEGSSNISPTP